MRKQIKRVLIALATLLLLIGGFLAFLASTSPAHAATTSAVYDGPCTPAVYSLYLQDGTYVGYVVVTCYQDKIEVFVQVKQGWQVQSTETIDQWSQYYDTILSYQPWPFPPPFVTLAIENSSNQQDYILEADVGKNLSCNGDVSCPLAPNP